MDCSIITSKTVLLFISLVFWAAGAGLAYVGAQVLNSFGTYDSFVEDEHHYALIPAVVIISISTLMFAFGLLGCFATIRESKVGLSFFFLIIMVMFAAEVAVLALSLIYQGKINGQLENSLTKAFSKFGEEGADTSTVDNLQTQLHCCGVRNYTSWFNTTWYQSHNGTVPKSCCKNDSISCTGRLDQLDMLNLEGCEVKLETLLKHVLRYAMLVVLGFAIIKFFGMLSVCVIACRSGGRRSGYQPLYA
ncbi:tetraspanin 36 [Corythoichthys intestinalis]|uniref:tetraspanin 36 n=1 Tax=Corythoichthys intestinalis TaxID=161448 RepID=UPI0025A647AB|nr:tetraspanin 36 [Corythoichthys intestinalis]XP_061804697.1 tetraspanin-36-like [Nerophis lumbriciformis]